MQVCCHGRPTPLTSLATWDDRGVVDSARARREAIRQLDDLRRRLAAAEDALADDLTVMKRAETAFDAANDRFAEAELVVLC
jgi:hypothetical protein